MYLEWYYKNLFEVAELLNLMTFTEDVKCIFGYTKKCLDVAHNNWNHVLMEGLVSKPLRTHLGSTIYL